MRFLVTQKFAENVSQFKLGYFLPVFFLLEPIPAGNILPFWSPWPSLFYAGGLRMRYTDLHASISSQYYSRC